MKFGSWFDKANLRYETILKITYCWWRNFSNDNTEHECGVGDDSVINWFNFCREICEAVLENDDDGGKIGGKGVKVEIDESKFGKRYQHKGRAVDGVWVFGGIEEQNRKNCFFEVVEKRDAATLIDVITRRIRPGSIIVSDCWKAYSSIPDLPGYDYQHLTVNHSVEFVNKDTGACTNHIEATWHALKMKKKGRGGMAKTLIDGYFAEFIFRRKYLEDRAEPFFFFLECIAKVYDKETALKRLKELAEQRKENSKAKLAYEPKKKSVPVKR